MPTQRLSQTLRPFTVTVAALLLLVGCSTSGTQVAAERAKASVDAYLAALEELPGDVTGIEQGLIQFENVYQDLAAPGIGDAIEAVYAPVLFFNDTVHTITDRDNLRTYMAQTGSNLTESQVEIHQVLRDEADVFVRWTMRFVIGEGDDRIESNSIGMTHLRFNAQGQVILHQDYWDSASALYAHLPIVGMVLRMAQDRLAEQ